MDLLFLIALTSVLQEAYVSAGHCRREEYQCLDGECIPFDKLRDTIVDCEDGSDELGDKTFVFMGTVCPIACRGRHDIYGLNYTGDGLRKVTKHGKRCSRGECRGNHGYGIMCDFNKSKEYCHVPFCDVITADNRVACDFSISSCGWQITSNATVEKIPKGSSFRISGQGTSETVFTSAIKYSSNFGFLVKYSIRIPRHCLWKVQSKRKEKVYWETKNCTDCVVPTGYRQMVHFIVFIRGYGGYNVSFSMNIQKEGDWSYRYMSLECGWGKFACDGFCRSYDILHDGVRDCKGTYDEGVLYNSNWREKTDCSREELKCYGSDTCIPIGSPPSMRNQCFSNRTTLPFEIKKAECPADYICKDSAFNSEPICINRSFICDGIPNCPRWDDEASCTPKMCPIGCKTCSFKIYRCLPSSMMDIPSSAISIDFSGHNVKLSDFCSLPRLKLLSLNLSRCHLEDIECLSYKFPNLLYLDVSYNNITNTFITFHQQIRINLDNNPIREIRHCYHMEALDISLRNVGAEMVSFNQLANAKKKNTLSFINRCQRENVSCFIRNINLSDNEIMNINFCGFHRSIDLSNNKIRTLFGLHYIYIYSLDRLILHGNLLTNVPFTISRNKLTLLDLSGNRIKYIAGNAFQKSQLLQEMYLQNNQLEFLNQSVFFTLIHLRIIHLQNNLLEDLPLSLFRDQTSLIILKIRNNRLKSLKIGVFRSLESLKELDLKNNNFENIKRGVLSKLVSLRTLDLSGNKIIVHTDIFRGMSLLKTLFVDEFALCCFKPKGVEHCHAPTVVSISSCSYLFDSAFIGISIWLFVCIIAFGSISVINSRIHQRNHGTPWQNQAVIHLTASDSMMGLCILIIGFKDVESKGNYGPLHNEWKQSWMCDFMRLLSSISIDSSMFIVVTVSIIYRFFSHKLQGRNYNRMLLIPWIGSIGFAVTSFVLHKSTPPSAFSSQQICFLLPIIYRHGFEDDNKENRGIWMLIWMTTHSVLSVVVASLGMSQFARKRNLKGGCGLNKAMELTVTAVVVRSIFICTIGYSKMFVDVPETVEELVILIIPCCSVISTLSRVFLNATPEIKLEIKDIIPKSIQSREFTKPKQDKMIIVLNQKMMRRQHKEHPAGIVVVFSDGYGWKRTVRNTKVVRHLIICDAPTHPTEGNIHVEDILINVVEISTGTSLVKSTTSYRDPDVNETNL